MSTRKATGRRATDRRLVPCHFCGSRGPMVRKNSHGRWLVDCDKCDESGPYAQNKAAAIEGWNKGHFDPRQEAES